jgi:hypothetical protein
VEAAWMMVLNNPDVASTAKLVGGEFREHSVHFSEI